MLCVLEISRYAFHNDSSERSFHTYTDPYGTSYTAVVYLRCQSKQNVSVQLSIPKYRVTPLKEIFMQDYQFYLAV